MDQPKHPQQPVYRNEHGTIRFKQNAIVNYLLDLCTQAGIADMNKLAIIPFSQEDREQFAQLIGYSVCGYCDLSYPSEESKDAAWEEMNNLPKDNTEDGDTEVL
jgi:hypothetical protein